MSELMWGKLCTWTGWGLGTDIAGMGTKWWVWSEERDRKLSPWSSLHYIVTQSCRTNHPTQVWHFLVENTTTAKTDNLHFGWPMARCKEQTH